MRFHLLALFVSLRFSSAHESESRGDEECGKIPKVSDYLIHWGERASPGEIPWAALLLLDDSGSYRCSGSLITRQHVLTAAHCYLDWAESKTFSRPLRVVLGSRCTRYPCEHMELHRVRNIYFPQDAKYGNPHDIAIVELEEPVTEKGIWPICLPSEHDQILRGEIARVAGWGIDHHNIEAVLRKLRYTWNQISYENGMYVIRGEKHMVCMGDSGVGLYRVKEARATVFGVLSAGYKCEVVHYEIGESEDSFTPVTKMLPWIQSILDGKVPNGTIHFAYDPEDELYKRQEHMHWKQICHF